MRVIERKGFLAPAVAGLLAVAAIGASSGSAAQSSDVRVEVPGTSQSSLLSTGKLRVLVESEVPGRVKVVARVQSNGSRPARIGRSRRVRFREPGSQVIQLRLSSAGRALFQDCRPKNLVVSARLKTAGAQAAAAAPRAVATVPLTIDSPCGSTGIVPGGVGGPGGGSGGGGGGGGGPNCPPDCNTVPDPTDWDGAPIDVTNASRCDYLDPAVCLQPFPNDYFTVADPSTDTDRRLNLNLQSMPQNKAGKPIDPTAQNMNDGFSPGSSLITRIPGLESLQAFENTGAVGIDELDAYDDPDQPVVVINADTGERQPIWSEIDFNPIDPVTCGNASKPPCEPESVNFIIRPAVNFDEGARYVVALRNLKDDSNNTIQPSDAFRVFRDNRVNTGPGGASQPEVESRRVHMEQLFQELGDAGIDRSSLYLTWDFTVASERNLTERALTIRDDAFGGPLRLGDTDLDNMTVEGTSPQFTINPGGVTNFTPAQNSRIARRVEGQITVPCYLNAPGCPPGSQFTFVPGTTVPVWNPANTTTANFVCQIPRQAIDGAPNPSRPSLYGHGLLGSASESTGGNIQAMSSEHNFMFCATDWAGFSTTDIGTVLLNLQDLSFFSSLVDRMQQGFVNFQYLGRAMIHPNGFSSNAAFQAGGQSVIDTQRLFYDGNSQGGIMGGALTALGVDFNRSVLGVPGINYSTLLTRSVDFEPYAEGQFGETLEGEICDNLPSPPSEFPDELEDALNTLRDELENQCIGGIPDDTELGLYDNYPNKLERPLIFALMQILWDRGEGNGYAHHMTDDPLDNTPAHTVLLHAAFGDHQVANVTAEVEARTIGASVYQPALDPGRHWEADGSDEIFGIPSIGGFPFAGSALVYWDGGPVTPSNPGGTATPPNENIPPRPPVFGSDPHSYPRNDVKGRAQKAEFLAMTGALLNPCRTVNNTTSVPPIVFTGGTATPCYSHGWTGLP